MIKTLKTFDLKNKRILLRLDLNVPMKDGLVMDDFRIQATVPTINHCLESGASLVIMSHLGRPGGKVNPDLSLMSVGEELAELLEMPIKFSDDCVSEDAHEISLGLRPGEIHLLENLRFHDEETANDDNFSALLAKHGDGYINDAFGTAHRAHASNVGVASYFTLKGMGLLLEKELSYFDQLLYRPKEPLVLVLGGAKISGKLELIYNFLNKADTIIIGGGMVFTFLVAKGRNVGKSIVDLEMIEAAKKILSTARSSQTKLVFPEDVLIGDSIEDSSGSVVVDVGHIPSDKMGLDIGPNTIEKFKNILQSAGSIVWNGPMGIFETEGYDLGTKEIAQCMSEMTQQDCITVVGGGDTAAAVNKFNLNEEMSHVSTGGGASLVLLSGNTLPAIKALEN